MNKILYVNACFKEGSRTNELAQHLLCRLNGEVQVIDLYEKDLKPLDSALLAKRDDLLENGKTDDALFECAKQFASADTVVIAAPYWDLLFPAVLRIYLENITVCGVTFRYSEKGIPEGLCKAKKLYYITTAGGFIGKNNFGFDYIKNLASSLFGIENAKFFSAEGLDIVGADVDLIMQKAKDTIAAEESSE